MVMASDNETSPSRAEFVSERLQGDKHLWKICSWHKNQRATNVGPKNDEMGWTIYERCRAEGAIVAQAHSHTYSRSKTMVNDADQSVDPACSDPTALCLSPGRHFFFDSSLGGRQMRPLDGWVASRPSWASAYNASFGALFIELHVDGDPRKARGYFKTAEDVVIDPPASSGKTTFTITRSGGFTEPPAPSLVTFEVSGAPASPGEDVFVVGDVSQLGRWSPSAGSKLSAVTSSTWRGAISLTQGRTVAWKAVTIRASDGRVTWESGANRSFVVPMSPTAGTGGAWRP